MPATDLPLLIDAALLAGEIAMADWGRSVQTWTKADDSPVSSADLAVDRAMRESLLHARPGYGWLSEESEDDHDRLSRPHCFILDPIDGTRAYLNGEATWSVSLAVTTGPEVTAAVVHLPARGLTYAATAQEARVNGVPLECSTHDSPEGARVMANKAVFSPEYWTDLPRLQRSFRPSMAYRLACVAHAKCDAMMTFRQAWEWDIAAGALIAEAAGARVSDARGEPLRFNTAERRSNGVLAANPGLHAALGQLLA